MPIYPFVDYPSLDELRGASRLIHTPGITPSTNSTVPGGGPEPEVIGTLIGLHYQRDTDLVYAYSKIQTTYLSDASFHVHWTKAVNTNQAGATVRWRLRYTVFDGTSQDVAAGPTGTIIWDDTYDDASVAYTPAWAESITGTCQSHGVAVYTKSMSSRSQSFSKSRSPSRPTRPGIGSWWMNFWRS